MRRIVQRERFLHRELAFPTVWRELDRRGGRGGFDAVLGNPPWDRNTGTAPILHSRRDVRIPTGVYRRHRMARLHALFFHLYGIPRAAAYILDHFPIVRREDQQAHARYLTRDLILPYRNAIEAEDLETRVTV